MSGIPDAIQWRLERLRDAWEAFAVAPGARLLCWTADPLDLPFVDAFVRLQCGPHADTDDLFVPFTEPFRSAAEHAGVLEAALRPGVPQGPRLPADPDSPWTTPPEERVGRSGTRLLAGAAGAARHLVLVLAPEPAPEPLAWADWLIRLVHGLPPGIRVLLPGGVEPDVITRLRERCTRWVMLEAVSLNGRSAPLELATASCDGEAGRFRVAFLCLAEAAARGDLPGAERAALAALQVARSCGSGEMETVVHLARGASALPSGLPSDAARAYAEAAGIAAPGGELALIAAFGEAGARLMEGAFDRAASLYERAAGAGAATGRPDRTIDGWRLAAHAHERGRKRADALRCGWKAIEIGAELPPEVREQTTLGEAIAAVVRLDGGTPWGRRRVEQRLQALLGSWGEGR